MHVHPKYLVCEGSSVPPLLSHLQVLPYLVKHGVSSTKKRKMLKARSALESPKKSKTECQTLLKNSYVNCGFVIATSFPVLQRSKIDATRSLQ